MNEPMYMDAEEFIDEGRIMDEAETKIFTVEIRHFTPGAAPERILVETDEPEFAKYTADLGIHTNSWQLVAKNF